MKDTALAVLAWVAWTALGWQSITILFAVLSAVGVMPYPTPDSAALGWLLWLQFFAGPLVGHFGVRQLVHALSRRTTPVKAP